MFFDSLASGLAVMGFFMIVLFMAISYTYSTCPIRGARIASWKIFLIYGGLLAFIIGIAGQYGTKTTTELVI
jgi:hypothetical protein